MRGFRRCARGVCVGVDRSWMWQETVLAKYCCSCRNKLGLELLPRILQLENN